MDSKKKYYIRLILKYFFGKISEKERRVLEKWLQRSSKNQQLFNELKEGWSSEKKAQEAMQIDPKQVYIQTKALLEKRQVAQPKTFVLSKIPLKNQNYLWRVAALLVLLLGSLLSLYLLQNKSKESTLVYTSFQTKKGEQKIIVLPDSTRVWLSGASTLEYPESFHEQAVRQVELHGEAFFDVTKDPEHPFIVQGKNLQVKVLGTRFRFVSDSTVNVHHVTVTEGRVQVSTITQENISQVIIPNERIGLDRDMQTLLYSKSSGSLDIPWESKELKFNNMAFSEIVKVLERSFDVKIHYPPHLRDIHITSSLSMQYIQNAMLVLRKTLQFDFLIDGSRIEIRLKKDYSQLQ